MYLKKLLTESLLVAAGLCVGASAWADTETLTLYSQDYESATDASSWTNTDTNTITLATDNTNYISGVAGGSDRYCYTNFYESTDFYVAYTSYKLSFDASITPKKDHSSQLVVMADGHGWPNSKGKSFLQVNKDYSEGTNQYLLLIDIAPNGTATIRGDENKTITVDGSWLTFTLDVTATSVNYTIVNRDTQEELANGTYTLPTGQSYKAKGLFAFLARTGNKMCFDNIAITTEVEAGHIETPTATLTGVNGINRTISFACTTEGVTLSYSTDGGTTFTEGTSVVISENTNIIVKATKGSSSATSESLPFEAGTTVALNAPNAFVSTLTLAADGLYYPTINASYSAEGVLLEPSAVLSATFNGEDVTLPFASTTNGTLVVTATSEGYATTSVEYAVKGFARVLMADYSKLESLSGVPSGIRKWSGNDHFELDGGFGIKAVRTDSRAWVQINRAGMIAYEVLSSDHSTSDTYIDPANSNAGNDSFKYFENGVVLSKIYYFTEGRSVVVSSVGYATLCPTANLDFSGITEMEACTAVVAANGKITYTPVSTVAMGEGVLLRTANGEAATIGVPVKTGEVEANENNAFVGIPEKVKLEQSTKTGYTNYILTKVDDVLGFYKVNPNGSWCNAGTAYLQVADAETPARGFFALWGGETTGIDAVEESKSIVGHAFNLNGQRVAQPAKGLYIVNGKKVIVK